jgi:hypothetical protein
MDLTCLIPIGIVLLILTTVGAVIYLLFSYLYWWLALIVNLGL